MNIVHIFALTATIVFYVARYGGDMKKPDERFDALVFGIISGILWMIAEIIRYYGHG